MPRIADFGCGPFSNLSYLYRNKLANLVGIDILAKEYTDLYSMLNIEHPIPLIPYAGENLNPSKVGGQCDITFVQNALDHTSSPALTWINLYKLTRTGGFLAHCHAVNEATHEKQDQLHQFDLRPSEENSLIIDNLLGNVFSLTDGLDLTLHYSHRWIVRDDYEYFVQIYRKTGEQISAKLLENALEELRQAYVKRSQWACSLENELLCAENLNEQGLKYNLHQARM